MSEKLEKSKVSFQDAMRHGILVRKGVLVKGKHYGPGEIIKPDKSDLDEDNPSDLAMAVGLRNYVTNGQLMGGQGLQIFASAKALKAAHAELMDRLLEKDRAELRKYVNHIRAQWQSFGIKVSKRLIDEMLDDIKGAYRPDIIEQIRQNLYEDHEVKAAA